MNGQHEDHANAGPARQELRTVSTVRVAPARRSANSRKPVAGQIVMILHNGLDHTAFLVAPCLLGCPGIARQRPVDPGSRA